MSLDLILINETIIEINNACVLFINTKYKYKQDTISNFPFIGQKGSKLT
jgi:hypothetical protein